LGGALDAARNCRHLKAIGKPQLGLVVWSGRSRRKGFDQVGATRPKIEGPQLEPDQNAHGEGWDGDRRCLLSAFVRRQANFYALHDHKKFSLGNRTVVTPQLRNFW
jgi:hypothetical protein